jgi:hypothetical protein
MMNTASGVLPPAGLTAVMVSFKHGDLQPSLSWGQYCAMNIALKDANKQWPNTTLCMAVVHCRGLHDWLVVPPLPQSG